MSLGRRIGRLEKAMAPSKDDPYGLGALAYDEITVQLLMIYRFTAADASASETVRRDASAQAAKIEDEIRSVARAWRVPPAPENLGWRRSMHLERTGRDDYELPLTRCGEGDNCWRWPDIMQRRRALRALPEIAALIAEGEAIAAIRAGITQ
jgi:hypothetical protein